MSLRRWCRLPSAAAARGLPRRRPAGRRAHPPPRGRGWPPAACAWMVGSWRTAPLRDVDDGSLYRPAPAPAHINRCETSFTTVSWESPSIPSSRPQPLSLMPPNGVSDLEQAALLAPRLRLQNKPAQIRVLGQIADVRLHITPLARATARTSVPARNMKMLGRRGNGANPEGVISSLG